MEELNKPSYVRASLPMTFITLLTAGVMAFAVHIGISWRPDSVRQSREAASTSANAPVDDVDLHRSPHGPRSLENQKSEGFIDTQITVQGKVEVGQTFALLGETTANAASIRDLNYQWVLPDGLEIIDGSAVGTTGHLGHGEIHQANLVVRVVKMPSKPVFFRAYLMRHGEAMGRTAVLALSELEPDEGEPRMAQKAVMVQTEEYVKAPRPPEEFRKRAMQ